MTTDVSSAEQLKTVLTIAMGGGVEISKLTIPATGTYTDKNIPGVGAVLAIDQEANKQLLQDFLQDN